MRKQTATVTPAMGKVKRYPFSGTKHAHDIDFRCNRCFNEMCDMDSGIANYDETRYSALEKLYGQLSDLLSEMHEGIVWLTGKQYGLAQECVLWAAHQRGKQK